MKNINHTGSDNLEALSGSDLSRSKKRKLKAEIISAAIALSCIAIGLIYEYLLPGNAVIAPLLYTVAFLAEGLPVLKSAIKGVFTRDFTNAMEMLVSIAIIACLISRKLSQ